VARTHRLPNEYRRRLAGAAALFLAILSATPGLAQRQRARDLGIPFEGRPGSWNAITDVPGVEVGQTTLVEGEGPLVVGEGPVRTGVTAIFPLGRTATEGVAAGWFSFNGAGEMTGTEALAEFGALFGPILLTNTLSVGSVQSAVVEWNRRHIEDPVALYARSLPVVAETWDGFLNDIYGQHVTREDVLRALDNARDGPVEEGNVGGGTGMRTFELKGGIGTSSRVVSTRQGQFTLGVFVQSNFGRRHQMRIAGVSVGDQLTGWMPESPAAKPDNGAIVPGGNSIVVVVATDAPLLAGQLDRVARRVALGLGRSGSIGMDGSGDIFLAFSTANRLKPEEVRSAQLETITDVNPLFEATVQATEEAIVNAMTAAETMTGIDGNVVHALPRERLQEVLRRYNRLREPAQSLAELLDEVHKEEFLLPYAPEKKIFVTEYYTLRSLLRQPGRAAIFLTAFEYRGNFWDIPIDDRNGPSMAARRGFFAYTTDYLGIGESYRPGDGRKVNYLTNAEAVSTLIDFVRRARKVDRVDLIGEGHGCEVAGALAADAERIRSVVLSTWYYKELGTVTKIMTPEFKAFLESQPRGYWVPNVMALTLSHVEDQEIRNYVFASQKDLEVPTGPFLQLFGESALASSVKAARVPALILHPEFGGWPAPGDMKNLERDWGGGATLVALPNSYHASRLEDAQISQRYFQELFDFVDPR